MIRQHQFENFAVRTSKWINKYFGDKLMIGSVSCLHITMFCVGIMGLIMMYNGFLWFGGALALVGLVNRIYGEPGIMMYIYCWLLVPIGFVYGGTELCFLLLAGYSLCWLIGHFTRGPAYVMWFWGVCCGGCIITELFPGEAGAILGCIICAYYIFYDELLKNQGFMLWLFLLHFFVCLLLYNHIVA